MAFAIQYQFEFSEAYTDSVGAELARFRVTFLRDGYADEPIEVLAGGSPVEIEFSDSSDNIFEAIKPQKFTFQLVCQEEWQARDFYVNSDRELLVQIEIDETNTGNSYTLLRQGWVLPADLSEQYGPKPYYVEISAACGLSTLKDRPLMSELGKRLINQISHAHLLQTALYHTDLTTDMVTAVNLFELADVAVGQTVNGLVIQTKDPLWQTLVPVEVYTKENNEVISCYEAIVMVLEAMRCRITQHNGIWWVVAVPELAGGFDPWNGAGSTTVMTRWYDNTVLGPPPNDAKNVSIDFNQTASRNGVLRVLADNPETVLLAHEDGVRIEQHFGRYVNKIPNGNFIQVGSDGVPTGWTAFNIAPELRYRSGTGTEADPYRMVIRGGGDEKYDENTAGIAIKIDYPLESREYTRFNTRTLKGRVRLFGIQAAKIIVVALRDDGPYLYTGGEWVLQRKLKKSQVVGTLVYNYTTVNGHKVSKTGWTDFNLDLGTLDRVKTFQLILCRGELFDYYPPNDPTVLRTEYADIRMEVKPEGLNLDGVQRTIVLPGKTQKDTTLSIQIGDVPDLAEPVDRIGTFFKRSVYPNLVPTTLWFRPNWVILSNGAIAGGGVGKPMIDIIANDYARQALFAVPTFDSELVGRMPYGGLTVLHVEDLPDLAGAILTRWRWKLKEAFHAVTAQKLMVDVPTADIPASKHEWQTPDGLSEVVTGQDGSPILPSDNKPYVSSRDQFLKNLQASGINPALIATPQQGGYVPIEGKGKLRATVLVGGQIKGIIPAVLRKPVKFPFPL